MQDPYELSRFVDAQDDDGTYDRALAELRDGAKRSHWMWFVFPQLAGLGLSAMSRRYAITGLDEATAYLAHPVLGPRLLECAAALDAQPDRTAEQIFGSVDATKLRSSLTLFARASDQAEHEEPVFLRLLGSYFDGVTDPATDGLL